VAQIYFYIVGTHNYAFRNAFRRYTFHNHGTHSCAFLRYCYFLFGLSREYDSALLYIHPKQHLGNVLEFPTHIHHSPISEFLRKNHFDRPTGRCISRALFSATVMLHNSSLQIGGNSGIQSFVSALEDVEVVHIMF
jgi:hypothetical protein